MNITNPRTDDRADRYNSQRLGVTPSAPPSAPPSTSLSTLRLTLLLVLLCAFLTTSFAQERQTVRLALDWLPNTNHTGIYVAQAQGWYEDAGVDLEILPYSGVSTEISVTSGRADVGVSSTESVLAAAAVGEPVVSIAAIMSTNTAAFAVLASSDITSPADFAGKRYAAFGAAYEEPILRTLIEASGGTGDVNSVVLNTFGFDALLAGFADIVWIFEGWQGVQAELEGIDVRLFNFSDYGLPDYYTPVFITSPDTASAHPERLQAFVDATARGYTFAAENPAEAARILLETTPPGTFPNPELVRRSQAFVSQFYLSDTDRWGYQDPAMWQGYPDLLLDVGVFTDVDGNPVRDLDVSALFTNRFVETE
ncbi:MAG: ABC transporter substrate-binding protein [Trueperaceae bacterium]|nr:ABC transporter substrate-binding protein [Trueperaceae bacterium]